MSFLKNHIASFVFFLISILICAVIFYFSAQEAGESTDTSSEVLDFLAGLFNSDYDTLPQAEKNEIIRNYMFFIRKAAHFLIFMLLGIFSHLSLRSFCRENKREFPRSLYILNVAFCLVYAISDEVHQLFVAGRSCEVRDVIIDFSGALFGIFSIAFLFFIIQKVKQKSAK